jgi:hypothetical protein
LLNEDGVWQQILRRKYLKGKTLSQAVRKAGDSHFWSGLMEVKDLVLRRGRFKVQDGTQARFWEDKWLGKDPLMCFRLFACLLFFGLKTTFNL